MNMNYKQAQNELLTSDSDRCQEFFKQNNNIVELGYFYLLKEDLIKAKLEFKKIMNEDIRAKWGYFLVELIQQKPSYHPSYFQLRNFFEIDMDILINHYKGGYIQTIVNYSDYLSTINSEICKYIGRVFYNHQYYDYAEYFFNQAKEKFYKDPELHFLISELYLEKKNIKKAIREAEICLEVLPGYFPAENMLRNLRENN